MSQINPSYIKDGSLHKLRLYTRGLDLNKLKVQKDMASYMFTWVLNVVAQSKLLKDQRMVLEDLHRDL